MSKKKSTNKKATQPSIRLTRVSDVKREEVQWLWPGRFPIGKLSVLAGEPGLGKSFVTLDMAARVSRGRRWPDTKTENPAGNVIIFSAEDDVADTIAPRLDAMEADTKRIHVEHGVVRGRSGKPEAFWLKKHVDALAKRLSRLSDVRLLVIDPVSAYMGSQDFNDNSQADVRAVLRPLAELARHFRVAIVAVAHPNKQEGQHAVHRVAGSHAYAAVARAVWMVFRDDEDPQRRLMLPVKVNVATDCTGLAFTIAGSPARVGWESETIELTADQFARAVHDGAGPSRLEEAMEFLQQALADGPRNAKDIRRLAEDVDIAEKTLRRAGRRLNVTPVLQQAGDGTIAGWVWALPDGQVPTPTDGQLDRPAGEPDGQVHEVQDGQLGGE